MARVCVPTNEVVPDAYFMDMKCDMFAVRCLPRRENAYEGEKECISRVIANDDVLLIRHNFMDGLMFL